MVSILVCLHFWIFGSFSELVATEKLILDNLNQLKKNQSNMECKEDALNNIESNILTQEKKLEDNLDNFENGFLASQE